MRKILAVLVLVALACLGLSAPAQAAVTDGATLGSWTTTQSCGSSTFTYNYDVTQYGGQKQLVLQWAEKTGPALSSWAPMVNSQMNGALDKSLSGRGYYQGLGSAPVGTYRITKGTPQASNWARVIFNYAGTDTQGRLLKTTANLCATGFFDFTSNVAPPPPTNIAGSFSMDFHCVSSVNTAYESHWTWYYTITGTNPSWTLTTTNLVKNVETGTPVTDLSFGGNGHIVNGAVIPFTWASGTIPDADLFADWGGGGILCEDGPKDLIANF